MQKPRVFTMPFSRVYPFYVQKAEKKGRSVQEVNDIIYWLTGYDEAALQQVINSDVDVETFFLHAPQMNPKASLIKGVICGYRVEEIEDETMRKMRYLDKLIDELAKGRPMQKIFRES